MRRKGFTLVELLVVVLAVGVGCAALAMLPWGCSLGKSQELANRAKCMGHLKNLAPGLKMYSDIYGPVRSSEGRDAILTSGPWMKSTDWENTATGTNRNVAPLAADARAITSLPWLLIRTNNGAVEMFVCPSDKNAKVETAVRDSAGKYYWDFSPRDPSDGKHTTSYSWQAPVLDKDGNATSGVNDDDEIAPIMSDRSPARKYTGRQDIAGWNSSVDAKDVSKFNSPNHTNGEVTQYLTSSYYCSRSKRPDCGQKNDFTFGTSNDPVGGAQWGTGESIATHKSTADSYLIGPK